MPLYEYECPGCGTFERVQKFSDPILTACPTCDKPVEKLISAPAIQFKGTGWYVTDYAKKGKDPSASSEKKSDSSSSAKSKTSESKPKGDSSKK